MDHYKQMSEPILTLIKNGWAAHGDGWAVHAPTREEALQKFREAERRHGEIDKLPFWYEQFDMQPLDENRHE